MGTADLDIKLGIDSVFEDLSSYTLVGTAYKTYNTGGLSWFNATTSQDGYYYKGILRNIDATNGFKVRVLVNCSTTGNTESYGYIKMNDGYYYIFGVSWSAAAQIKAGWAKSTSRPSLGGNLSDTGSFRSGENYLVVELHFKSNGNVDLASSNLLGSWTYTSFLAASVSTTYGGVDVTTWPATDTTRILEYGFGVTVVSYIINEPAGIYAMYADLDTGTQFTGTATLENVVDISATRKTSVGGGGKIRVTYDTSAQLDTIKANARKSVTIYDNQYGMLRMKGEIVQVRRVGRRMMEYQIEQVIKKLDNTPCLVNPVNYHSEIRNARDSNIYDHFAAWSVNAYQDKLVVTEDSSLYKQQYSPVSNTWYEANQSGGSITSISPDTQSVGDTKNLYYYNKGNEDTNDVLGAHQNNTLGESSRLIAELNFKLWFKNDVAFDNISMRIVVRFSSLSPTKVNGSGSDAFPQLTLYNYNTTLFEELYNYENESDANVESSETWATATIEAESGFCGKSPIFDNTFDLIDLFVGSASDFKDRYIGNISAANASGFKSATMQLRLEGPICSSIIMDPKMEIHLCILNVSKDTDSAFEQGQEIGLGYIASNTANTLVIDDTKAFSITDWPVADGATPGDDYKICDSVVETLTAIDTANSDWTITQTFTTDYTTFAVSFDLTDYMIMEFLQKMKDEFNWVIRDQSTESSNIVEVLETPTSTGLTIENADVIDYESTALNFVYDTKMIRDKIYVEGDFGVNKTTTNTVELSDTLGDEWIFYDDKELITQRHVDEFSTNIATRHSKAAHFIPIPIDITNPTKNWSLLEEGKLIHVNTDDYDSTGGDELIISAITYEQIRVKGNQFEVLILYLQRRNL